MTCTINRSLTKMYNSDIIDNIIALIRTFLTIRFVGASRQSDCDLRNVE